MTSQRTRVRMVGRLREQGIHDEAVLAAMLAIPRHLFVDEALALRAYEDIALPIGQGQTISQPYVVARMCELLRNGRDLCRVLEVGAGCGYQSAVLSKLAREVIAIERLLSFVGRARRHLGEARVPNVLLKHGDGMNGFAARAPFDGIIVAAASGSVPKALKAQLATGGRLVAPVGDRDQRLRVIDRTESGFRESEHEAVKFVPLVAGRA